MSRFGNAGPTGLLKMVDDIRMYKKLGEMVKKKLSEEKRFVQFDERKEDGVVSTEMFKILNHGNLFVCLCLIVCLFFVWREKKVHKDS